MSRTMRRWIALQLVLALALAGLVGCGRALTASLPAEAHFAPAETRVDPVQLQETINQLAGPAQLGRLAGSDAGAAVADWIAGRFGALGLMPKGTDGFRQPFTFGLTRFAWPAGLALTGAEQTRPYRYRSDFRLDPTSGAGTVSAPVVYVGYGLTGPDRDDYRGHNVRGKAVMFFRDCPAGTAAAGVSVATRVAAAVNRGAVAVLLIDQSDHMDWSAGVHPVAAGVPVVGISPTVAADLFTASRYSLSSVVSQTERGPVEPAELVGKVEITVTQVTETAVPATNIVGYLPGSDDRAGYYIVGAHFDHLGTDIDGEAYPGVVDNASGVAVMLETARVLAIDRPRAGVLFVAFDAEEEGLFGSNYLAAHLPLSSQSLLGMINVDTIGVADGVWRIRHSAGAEQLAAALAEQASRLGADVDLEAATGGSDEHSFALRGLPALRLMDREAAPRMHSVREPIESVSAAQLATATQAVVAAISDNSAVAAADLPADDQAAPDAPTPTPEQQVVWQPSGASAGDDGWLTFSTPHYTVKYREGMKVSGDPADQAEQIYNLLAARLGSEPELPLTLVLTSGRAAQESAVFAVYPNAARPITDAWVHYPSRTMVIDTAGRDRTQLAQAIAHEGAHLFAAAAMRRITQTPWVREYLATYLERRVAGAHFGLTGWDSKEGYTALLGQIKVQPWAGIAAEASADADAAVEAASVFFYLEQQYGEEKLTDYWQRLLAEGDPEKAFKAVYRKTSFQLEQEWRTYYGLK
ncbi:MAG: M28 family peptidase [Chloroflexota bacterium]